MSVKLRASVLPASVNTLAYAFGSPLREAAEPLREALRRQLATAPPLVDASLLEARVDLAFGDERYRNPRNYEPVAREAIVGALADVGTEAELRRVDVHLVKDRKRRPSTTIALSSGERS